MGVRFASGTQFQAHLFMDQIAASLKCHTFQAAGWALGEALGGPRRVPGPPDAHALHSGMRCSCSFQMNPG